MVDGGEDVGNSVVEGHVPLPRRLVPIVGATLPRSTSPLSTVRSVDTIPFSDPVLAGVSIVLQIVSTAGDKPANGDSSLEERRTVDRAGIFRTPMACCSDYVRTALDSESCFVCHATVAAAITVGFLVMVDTDRDIEYRYPVFAGVRDSFDKVSSFRGPICGYDPVDVEHRFRCEVPQELEYVSSVVGRVRLVALDVIVLNGDVDGVVESTCRAEKGVDDADANVTPSTRRVWCVESECVRLGDEAAQI